MNNGADFLALYKELGVDPECDTDTFKRAYRRRVSGLHPDRAGGSAGDEDTLKKLNYACSAALEFHRAHGRFPGTAVRSAPPATAMRTKAVHAHEIEANGESANSPPRWRMAAWLGLAIALTVLLLSTNDDEGTAGQAPATDVTHSAGHAPAPQPVDKPMLKLGMSPDQVVAVIGPPFSRDDTGQQWLYGASWVRVACGQLVDWYSSPLQPLKVANHRPGPDDTIADFRPRRHCPTNP
ncbi:MAG: J domain-containing protein [Pseudoxanthomonas sp.]